MKKIDYTIEPNYSKYVTIDYCGLPFVEQRELDRKAYEKYYYNHWHTTDNQEPMTYNNWYNTDSHVKYITPLIRKIKLKKIEKADI